MTAGSKSGNPSFSLASLTRMPVYFCLLCCSNHYLYSPCMLRRCTHSNKISDRMSSSADRSSIFSIKDEGFQDGWFGFHACLLLCPLSDWLWLLSWLMRLNLGDGMLARDVENDEGMIECQSDRIRLSVVPFQIEIEKGCVCSKGRSWEQTQARPLGMLLSLSARSSLFLPSLPPFIHSLNINLKIVKHLDLTSK